MNKGKRMHGPWVKVPLEDAGSKEPKLLSCWRHEWLQQPSKLLRRHQ